MRTVLALLIVLYGIIHFFGFKFRKKIIYETNQMLSKSTVQKEKQISRQLISGLPGIVKQWLLTSGIVEKEPVYNVYLEQDVKMLIKPGQKKWINAQAKQYFTVEPPAFNWSVKLKINPVVFMVGRDRFEDGKGRMTIKLFSVFPIVDVKDNEKLNQATLQRYLAEIIWFPSAAISPFIQWEEIGEGAAKATMSYEGTTGSGVFHFDENGNFKKFVAMRFKDVKDTLPTEWTVEATKTEVMNGIKIPSEAQASWKLENGQWTWLKLKVKDVKYNVGERSL